MNLAVETSTLSFGRLGRGILILTAATAVVTTLRGEPAQLIWLLAPAILGGLLAFRSLDYLIFRPAESVILQIRKPLDLLSFPYETPAAGVRIQQPHVFASILAVGPWTLLRFRPSGQASEKELYLIRTLIKYQSTLRKIL